MSKTPTPVVSRLGLFCDDDGLIRCDGRIENSSQEKESKQPILLPATHYFTELLIKEQHEVVHHNGIRDTLNLIRQKYWIQRGREAVKRIVRRCVVCRKLEAKPFPTPRAPQLPACRVSEEPPFCNTGIDFAGPIYVKKSSGAINGNNQDKVYIALFTCASTRALHLELVENMSAATFLQAFRRFSSRRGLPTKVLTDNAKTFKSASKEVRMIGESKEVNRYFANRRIAWEFITEKAPWHGGFWERMVRSVKRCLKKAIGRASLSFGELRTLLVEIETTLNNRPLTFVYDDEQGISYALTPSHLIYGRQISSTPNDKHYEIVSTNQSLTKRAKYHQRVLNQFIKQWRTEYLLSLRESSKSTRPNSDVSIAVGDMVILRNDNTRRTFWKLAKVEKLLPSSDGIVRSAKVMVNGESGKQITLRRPIQHLIPLAVKASTTEEDICVHSRDQHNTEVPDNDRRGRPRRKAAVIGEIVRRQLTS